MCGYQKGTGEQTAEIKQWAMGHSDAAHPESVRNSVVMPARYGQHSSRQE